MPEADKQLLHQITSDNHYYMGSVLGWFKDLISCCFVGCGDVFFSMKKHQNSIAKNQFCSDHIFAGHNEDRRTSWVVILGWLS